MWFNECSVVYVTSCGVVLDDLFSCLPTVTHAVTAVSAVLMSVCCWSSFDRHDHIHFFVIHNVIIVKICEKRNWLIASSIHVSELSPVTLVYTVWFPWSIHRLKLISLLVYVHHSMSSCWFPTSQPMTSSTVCVKPERVLASMPAWLFTTIRVFSYEKHLSQLVQGSFSDRSTDSFQNVVAFATNWCVIHWHVSYRVTIVDKPGSCDQLERFARS